MAIIAQGAQPIPLPQGPYASAFLADLEALFLGIRYRPIDLIAMMVHIEPEPSEFLLHLRRHNMLTPIGRSIERLDLIG